MSEETISNQTCTKCQNCGQWTNYAGDAHHQAREAEITALRQSRADLVEIHKVIMCISESPGGSDADSYTVRGVKDMAYLFRKMETELADRRPATSDFAKIIRASDGRQVLFFVEPAGGDYHVHQVINHDGFQADLKFGFTSNDADKNEREAMAMFDSSNQERADNVIKAIAGMMEGGAS